MREIPQRTGDFFGLERRWSPLSRIAVVFVVVCDGSAVAATLVVDLSTTYLGLRLAHPFIAGASPLADTVDRARRLEDAGASAIVLRSLFEEQITMAQSGRIHGMDPYEPEFAARLSAFPPPSGFVFSPVEYLEHLRRVKSAVHVPVFASLNGTTSAPWFTFARQIEQAGADGLEVNMYDVVSEPHASGAAVERRLHEVVGALVRMVRIPVAAKLSPYYTALGALAADLESLGVHGLVLFNRLYQADIDIDRLQSVADVSLSTSQELLLRLRWAAILHDRVRASIAVTGGVATPQDAVKAILAGASAVQQVSALLRHGPSYLITMRRGLEEWLESHQLAGVEAARGLVSLQHRHDTSAFERGTYLRMLQGATSGNQLS